MDKIIAIIPAKGLSKRLPRKNLLPFHGLPLFLHSAFYARQEGVVPVVSTDCDNVRALCEQYGIRHVPEIVDERDMCNCIRQTLEQTGALAFALLQPTSPLRKPGMLRRIISRLEAGDAQSIYTARLAHFPSGKIPAFDGSIVACSRAFFDAHGLLSAASLPVDNPWPFCEEIDTAAQFDGLQYLACHQAFASGLAYLPHMRIAIVSNKRSPERDFSAEIDAMDIVMRINSFDNLDTGLTGTRTDLALICAGPIYRSYSDDHNHLSVLRKCERVWFTNVQAASCRQFARQIGLTNWAITPPALDALSGNFTTLAKGISLARFLYPLATLYLCGDLPTAARTSCPTHLLSAEDSYLHTLVHQHHLIPLNFPN